MVDTEDENLRTDTNLKVLVPKMSELDVQGFQM